ncbi:MAG: hypothetical protein ACE5EI_10750 [Thermodesulfobacteriota bacterium]
MSVVTKKVDPDVFYGRLKSEGVGLRDILWPLVKLSARERAVFTEYHYWNTHMKIIAKSHRISLGRAYAVLYRAEEKIAAARAQKEEENF